eukprot:SAG22_NODE_270_length_13234_cov_13.248573_3_plen_193_part_00
MPTLHTLEQTLRENGWEDRPSYDWAQPALSCHTCDMWVYTMCCPCCVAGYVAHDARQSGFLCCLASFVAFPCVGAHTRGKLRGRYGISGSCPLDWCCHLCCPIPSLVQEAAEVRQQRRLRSLYPDPEEEGGGLDMLRDVAPGQAGRSAAERLSLVEQYAKDPNDKALQKAMKKRRKEQAKNYDWEVALPSNW